MLARLAGKPCMISHNFSNMIQSDGKVIAVLHGWLSGGTEHYGGSIVLRQLSHYLQAWLKIVDGEGLNFVKDDHRLGQVVQFTAARGLGRKQRLVELDRGRNHKRSIPVLRGKTTCNSLRLDIQIAMVLDYRIWHLVFKYPQGCSKDCGRLLDDARKGDDVDHAP